MAQTLPVVSEPCEVPAGTVYFVRHGLVHNPGRIAYGWLPRFRLATEGQRQAEAAAIFLVEREVVLILSSPLLRARQTSRIIAERQPGMPLRHSRLLIESGLAHYWEGETWTDIPAKHPEAWHAFQHTPGAARHGEDMAAMARRMRKAMALALRLSAGTPAVCVSHRDPILALRLAVEGRPYDDLHHTDCNPASVTTFVSNGGHLRVADYTEPYRVPSDIEPHRAKLVH